MSNPGTTSGFILWMQRLQKKPLFKFLSSVRMAVPLMLILGIVVAVGTLYESRYNAQVAGLKVYQTLWFQLLLALLWINILFAALSRIPYKLHHTGFVIVHIGLLTLLVGAMITARVGIDGHLRVEEGKSSNRVSLPNLTLQVALPSSDPQRPTFLKYQLPRSLNAKDGDALGLFDFTDKTGLIVERYLPFVQASESFGSGVSVEFKLQSAFFNVDQTLNSVAQPDLQMGPAHLRLLTTAPQSSKPTPTKAKPQKAKSSGQAPTLVILNQKNDQELKTVLISDLVKTPLTLRGVKISLTQVLQEGVVSGGKLVDNGRTGMNPALELKLDSGGKSIREIAFAKFPGFSLSQEGTFGLKFTYNATINSEATAPQQAEPMHGTAPAIGAMGAAGGGHEIRFHVTDPASNKLEIVLVKNGKTELQKQVAVGDSVTTPWMGMKITIQAISGSANPGSMGEQSRGPKVRETTLMPKSPLPPSAVLVRRQGAAPDTALWLVEGDAQRIPTSMGDIEVYYGGDSVDLPFYVVLDQFRKIDYPGTTTPMSFESSIHLANTPDVTPQSKNPNEEITIQMNEPLSHEGYLLYQSSYEQGNGMPTASIFSVNRDPARFLKYLGAVTLTLGIAIFAIMRSRFFGRWLNSRANRRQAKHAVAIIAVLASSLIQPQFARAEGALGGGDPTQQFKEYVQTINPSTIEALPVQSHGRIKPLHTLARDTVLYLTGKYQFWGIDSVRFYLGLTTFSDANGLKIINVRDPETRIKLGFTRTDRWVSLRDLESSQLQTLATPLLEKEKQNERSLEPHEKSILEVQNQAWLLHAIMTGDQLIGAAILNVNMKAQDHPAQGHGSSGQEVGSQWIIEKAQNYLKAIAAQDSGAAKMASSDWIRESKLEPMPEMFRKNLDKVGIEVTYNKMHIFFWVGMLYILMSLVLLSRLVTKLPSRKTILAILAIPLFFHALGFVARVYITGFAPVTSMYGTMVWMAFGVVLFGSVLFTLYGNTAIMGWMLVGSGATLLLTENIPLVLSPDMDPIVAVLRNNFWLTIHVMTVSISYAAFTGAMIIGNVALIKTLFKRQPAQYYKDLAHLCYRTIQLGVFLLTAGIILGGWWADYSWGRFWGWDPKETWALIADLGFLAILHARFLGWLGPFGVLIASPIAYLLVIMAWYGVNFILAAGLHSYGFSSGGATMVLTFVIIQLALVAAVFLAQKWRPEKPGAA